MNRSLFLILFFSVNAFLLRGQYLSNPSFENYEHGDSVVPYGWTTCNPRSTPDVQPGSWDVEMKPSNGSCYLGLIILPAGRDDGPKKEDVSTRLLKPLFGDSLYRISIDLAYSAEAFDSSVHQYNYGTRIPQKLRISGGKSPCSFDEVLVLSDRITNTDWERYNFIFKPTLDTTRYIKMEIYADTLRFCYMLLDNMSLSNVQITGIKEVCQGQQNVEYELPQDSCLQYYDWRYTGEGVSVTKSSSPLVLNFGETATSGDLVASFTNCEGTEGSLSIPVTVDSLPAEVSNIMGGSIACSDLNNDFYIDPVPNAESYVWDYSGPGTMFNRNTDHITIYFPEAGTSGILTVTPVNHCGTGAISPPLTLEVKLCDLNIPNSFSPNGDGINDEWVIDNLYENSRLVIFDRSGKIVYETDNYRNDWNGDDYRGKKLPTDTYWYVLTSNFIAKPVRGFIYLKR